MNTKTQTGRSQTPGAVLYTRVSTGEQEKHGTSPETQKDACRAKALSLSLRVVSEYHDGGISGGLLLARPGMQAALADIRAGRADTLICYSLSRYSRDVEHQQAIKKAVKAAGGRIVFCDADFDDTAAGELNFTIQGGFAEYERKVIRERSVSGHRKRAQDGIQTARLIAPYGYAIPTKADVLRGLAPAEDLGKYRVIEGEAAVVRQLFVRYAAGTSSLTDLARWLNAEQVPTAGGARLWIISTLRYLLANPVYKGVASYGRSGWVTDEARLGQTDPRTGRPLRTLKTRRAVDPETCVTWPVPALVTEAVWDAVQANMAANRIARAGNPRQVRMLSGRIHCPQCGAGMGCHTSGARPRSDGTRPETFPRYICTRYRQTLNSTGTGECVPEGFAVPDVEAAVLLAVQDASQHPGSVRHALAEYARELPRPAAVDPRRELAALDRALTEWQTRQAATVKAQIAGIMAGADPAAYAALFGELAAERKDLEDRRGVVSRLLRDGKEAGKAKLSAGGGDLKEGDVLQDVGFVLAAPDVTGAVKRDILGTVIERVICRRGEDNKAGAEIVFRAGVFGEAEAEEGGAEEEPGEVEEDGGASIQQKRKQTSSPSFPCGVSTTVAACPALLVSRSDKYRWIL